MIFLPASLNEAEMKETAFFEHFIWEHKEKTLPQKKKKILKCRTKIFQPQSVESGRIINAVFEGQEDGRSDETTADQSGPVFTKHLILPLNVLLTSSKRFS